MLPRLLIIGLPLVRAKFGSHRRACALDEQELVRKTQHKEFHQIMDSMHGPRCGGFFVEAGANTGVNSVTRAFEQIGWHGLCVEANPYLYHNFLVKNRRDCENIHAALVDGPAPEPEAPAQRTFSRRSAGRQLRQEIVSAVSSDV